MANLSQTCLSDILSTQGGELTSEVITQILNEPQSEGTFFHYYQQSAKMSANMKHLKLQMHRDCRQNFTCSSVYNPIVNNESNVHPETENVTLSMEVWHIDHVELRTNRLQLKLEDSVARIISDTRTDIQFPDQTCEQICEPRHSANIDQMQYNNQILIRGSLNGVNEARKRLRALTPIRISFATKEVKAGVTHDVIMNHIDMLRAKGHLETVSVQTMSRTQDSTEHKHYNELTIHVIGRLVHSTQIVAVCESFKKALFDAEKQEKIVFSSCLEIPVSQWEYIAKQPDFAFIKALSKTTNADIHFPEKLDRQMATFFCTSPKPLSVIEARTILQSFVPIQLCIDVADNELNEPIKADESRTKHFFDSECRVTIKYSKSEYEIDPLGPEEPLRHFVQLMTQEFNISGLIKAVTKVFIHARFISASCLNTSDYAWLSPIAKECSSSIGRMGGVKCAAAPNALLGDLTGVENASNENMIEYEPYPNSQNFQTAFENIGSNSMTMANAKSLLQNGLLSRIPPVAYGYHNNFHRGGPFTATTYSHQIEQNTTNASTAQNTSASANVSLTSNRSYSRPKVASFHQSSFNERSENYARPKTQYNGNQERNQQRSYTSNRGSSRGRSSYSGRGGNHGSRQFTYNDEANADYDAARNFNHGQKQHWKNPSRETTHHQFAKNEHYVQKEEQDHVKKQDSQPRNQVCREDSAHRTSHKSAEERHRQEGPSTPKSADRSSQKVSLVLRNQGSHRRSDDKEGLVTSKSIEPMELIRVASTEPQSLERSREIIEQHHIQMSTSEGNLDYEHRRPGAVTYAQILKSTNGIDSK